MASQRQATPALAADALCHSRTTACPPPHTQPQLAPYRLQSHQNQGENTPKQKHRCSTRQTAVRQAHSQPQLAAQLLQRRLALVQLGCYDLLGKGVG